MPRKTRRTLKPPLSFLEPSLGGARLQRVPDVRAALNPKSLITEKGHNSTTLTSWVNPQFDQSHVRVPPARRGRRGCQSSTSVSDQSTQLSGKQNVARFPSLSFQETAADPPVLLKHTVGGKVRRYIAARRQQSGRSRHLESPRRRLVGDTGCLDQGEALLAITITPPPLLPAVSPPPAGAHTPAPPTATDVDTPRCPYPPRPSPLSQPGAQAPPCTPPEEEVLVADTPERDYGVKVTWRRRRGLMLFLKERGLLSDSDALIDS